MSERTNCRNCGKELVGAIETTTATEGSYVYIVQQETSDCNWAKCTYCKTVLCKSCRRDRPRHCCSVGRIIDTERARAAVADSNKITT